MVSLRPNYFIFVGYLKMGSPEGGSSEPSESPLDPPLICKNLGCKIVIFLYISFEHLLWILNCLIERVLMFWLRNKKKIKHTLLSGGLHLHCSIFFVIVSASFMANTLQTITFYILQTIFVTCILQCTFSGQHITFYIPSNSYCYMYLPVHIFWPTQTILHSFKQYLSHVFDCVHFLASALHFTFLQQ